MYLIFLGPPGAGKGTQAKIISQKMGLPQISTGELFRNEMKMETKLGKRISNIMKSGKLVDDDTTLEIFKERLSQPDCQNGAILDGIPRTVTQAKMLEQLFNKLGIKLDFVVYINISEKEALKRLSGRLTCQAQGHSFHKKYKPPQKPGICDYDGSPLYQRDDQKPKAIKERLSAYNVSTKPLLDFYKNKDLLISLDGNLSIDELTQEIEEKIL